MENILELIGKDLAGWKIEKWYKLKIFSGDRKRRLLGHDYFNNKKFVKATAMCAPKLGYKYEIEEMLILTKDGKTGHLINPESATFDTNLEACFVEAIETLKNVKKPTKQQKVLLGIK